MVRLIKLTCVRTEKSSFRYRIPLYVCIPGTNCYSDEDTCEADGHGSFASLHTCRLSSAGCRLYRRVCEGAVVSHSNTDVRSPVAWRAACVCTGYNRATLPASLSGTFLQTLPDLVTPLKGHFLSPRSCPPTRSAPFGSSGTNMTVEAT